MRRRLRNELRRASGHASPPCDCGRKVTAGLKWAPENRAEREDEGDERRACRERVGEQRDGHVAAGQALAHDARADDGRQQHGGAHAF